MNKKKLKKIKKPLIIWGIISGMVCNLLMLEFALEQALTGKNVILDFNIYKEMWIEIPLLALGLTGLILLYINKIKEVGYNE